MFADVSIFPYQNRQVLMKLVHEFKIINNVDYVSFLFSFFVRERASFYRPKYATVIEPLFGSKSKII